MRTAIYKLYDVTNGSNYLEVTSANLNDIVITANSLLNIKLDVTQVKNSMGMLRTETLTFTDNIRTLRIVREFR